jgi:hypothetical protein
LAAGESGSGVGEVEGEAFVTDFLGSFGEEGLEDAEGFVGDEAFAGEELEGGGADFVELAIDDFQVLIGFGLGEAVEELIELEVVGVDAIFLALDEPAFPGHEDGVCGGDEGEDEGDDLGVSDEEAGFMPAVVCGGAIVKGELELFGIEGVFDHGSAG